MFLSYNYEVFGKVRSSLLILTLLRLLQHAESQDSIEIHNEDAAQISAA